MGKLRIFYNYLRAKHLKFKSREELESWQDKKVISHLKKIIRKSKFYKELYRGKRLEDWKTFPIISKKIMMYNFDSLNTVSLNKEEAFKVAIEGETTRDFTPEINNITIGLSHGTSGNRGIYIASQSEREKWAGYMIASVVDSIFDKQKVALFLRANSNLNTTVQSKNLKFMFFDLKEDWNVLMEKLEEYQPTILVGQPSVLDLMRKSKISIHPIKIISCAETLDEDVKERLERFFKIRIDQIYQATEGFIAKTCKNGKLHLNEDIMVVQKKYLDKKTGRFSPIITDFNRESQPIIRYELNDILIEGECDCGSVMTCIEKIEGRCDDIIYLDGKDIFPDFLIRRLISSTNIENFRITQLSLDKIKLELDNLDEQKKAIDSLKDLFSELDVKTPIIEIERYTTNYEGKLRRVINQVK